MAEVRSSVFVLLLFVTFGNVATKPFFAYLFCDIICEYFDDSASSEDNDCGCDPTPVRTTSSTAIPAMAPPSANNPPVNFMIAPGEGLNATFVQNGGSYYFSLFPWAGQGGSAPATPAPSAANPATTPAGATTAAAATTATPGATPAPAAGATTAAATTAATTAAAGK